MTNVNLRIAASTDDAHDTADGGFPGFSANANFLYCGYVGARPVSIGLRFLLATDILDGSTIDDADLTFTDVDFGSGGNKFLDVYGEKSLTPATFSAGADPISRTKTDAVVSWDYSATSGAAFTSPDLKAIAQELIDDLSGDIQDIAFIVVADPAQTGQSNHDVDSFDGVPASAPLLDLNYTAGGGGGGISIPVVQHHRQRNF